ncbi:MAG TPA: copper amine oxidase N-terminal domain-containing protein [Candidatus Cybelea sp.]
MIHRASELYAGLRWQSLVIVALCALAISCVLAFSTPIAMFVDGERVDSDVAPVTTASEHAFVPLRSIADALGAETVVDKPGVITVTLGDQSLRLRVGDMHAKLNGMPLTLKRAPFRVRGRVLVPIDAIASALHVHATYDPRTARIEVRTPGIGQVP